MKLDFKIHLEQTQKLIITPELKLAIALLQYSAQELQDHIQEELLNNPVLEVQEPREEDREQSLDGEESPAEADSNLEEHIWEEYMRDRDPEQKNSSPVSLEHRPFIENCPGGSGSMLEDLLGQLRLLSLKPCLYSMAAYLAGNLDHNGYLQGELEELARAINTDEASLGKGLAVLQSLEPAGIGCRSLRECLCLQLQRREDRPAVALDIVQQYLPAAADERYNYIASRLGCPEEEIEEAVVFIRTLNPKPGSVYGGGGEETRYIVPDVIVEKVGEGYVVVNNDGALPQLMISPFYQGILRSGSADEQISSYIKSRIEKAYWLIRSIEQRRLTLYRVSQQIVDIQSPFLDDGIKHLKPLTLKEVAQVVGVHESTVSRATANKYIQTPRGLFPLKFFFSSGLGGSGGSDYSSHSIKTYLRELVEAENPARPLSDQALTNLLQERGIAISRRTVAKYREEIAIPASYKRKV